MIAHPRKQFVWTNTNNLCKVSNQNSAGLANSIGKLNFRCCESKLFLQFSLLVFKVGRKAQCLRKGLWYFRGCPFEFSPAVNKASGELWRQLGNNDNTVSLTLFALEDVMLVLNIEP